MLDQTIPQNLQHLIRQELRPAERISWSGMPKPKFFSGEAVVTFLFGIPWTAFAIFWTLSAGLLRTLETFELSVFTVFSLFGVPFVLIGFGMLLSPVFNFLRTKKTAYVITDQRAISFLGGRTTEVRTFEPQQLDSTYRRELRDGSGDIVITKRNYRDSDGDTRTEEGGFIGVRDVQKVERLLKQLAKQRLSD